MDGKTSEASQPSIVSFILELRQQLRNKFLWLLLALASLIFLPAFVTNDLHKDVLIYCCLGLVLVTGVFVLARSSSQFYWALLLAIGTLGVNLLPVEHNSVMLFLIRMLSLMIFFGWLLVFVFRRMTRSRRISEDIIFGAVNGYLLMGLLGGFCFRLIYFFDPNAFVLGEGLGDRLDVFTYFSFVTLTNLGYGDITPVASSSQSTALFLAISGQMYLAIVIGILVGKFILFREEMEADK